MQQVARATEIEDSNIAGTRDVVTIGGPGHVIRVVMDADRINAHSITAQDLKAALQECVRTPRNLRAAWSRQP